MAEAIIRHTTSGEHFLARLDDAGDAIALSPQLPVIDATDPDTGEIDWSRFQDANLEYWEDAEDRWTSDRFFVVHRFDG
jgi:hypothetical protein